jgi:thiamine-phosphate pyrophosphorylase
MNEEQAGGAHERESERYGSAAAGVVASRPTLILVTDPAYADERILEVVEASARVLPRGAFCVQLRDKKKSTEALRAFAEKLRATTRELGALFMLNGNVALAKEVGADGVHLGGDAVKVQEARAILGDAAFITIAAHSDQAVKLGARDGANGALVSAIFASPGKVAGRGVDALRSARVVAPKTCAIYALGGVERANAAECFLAGADGVAVIRALLLASDPAVEARAIHQAKEAI